MNRTICLINLMTVFFVVMAAYKDWGTGAVVLMVGLFLINLVEYNKNGK